MGLFSFKLKSTKMATITIDGKDYNLDDLSNDAKAQIASMQFVDSELERLNAKSAVLNTARMAYAKALTELLPKDKKAKK